MVTTVGWESHFIDALKDLVSLEYDALEAYEAAINRLETKEYKEVLNDFKQDHERHIRELSTFFTQTDTTPPTGPGPKSILTQGKVILANIVGDQMILRAMHSNELDTNTAYERMTYYEDVPPDIKLTLEKNFQDEKKHKAWLEATLDAE